ncbi:beta-Ala-His dipeptidase [sulfur-oxidizing endosymbiont of Gigantopelta aegis]|uniref:beta-Ala-His dipeptidase n=1 Tax=sulfur-oxidizing endosymbiont of Gigantopelta aegis TaxID=2794934 RepID=UPI0018DB4113|nr:beta-Ala-His dipeptidase [sulfur-oxidizing endosymbiont of Gigantopelta aegis]
MIDQLPPLDLWQHFIKFCDTPRPSKHEAAIIAYIHQQGVENKVIVEHDAIGNILLRVPAIRGHENADIIALQCHVDMVTQANSDSSHDFLNDALQLQITDGWLHAINTTLGADNGIGCAAMLALMTDKSLQHGPLELLFTVDEEAGMGGAFGLQENWLQAKKLLNLDTEEEGEIYIGCAGGVDINASRSLAWQSASGEAVEISLTGLTGGHSGVDIHLNRANANVLLAQELLSISQTYALQLVSFHGGSLRNAIPREAFVTVFTHDAKALINAINTRNQTLKQLYHHREKELLLTAQLKDNLSKNKINQSLTENQSTSLLSFIASHPNGVIKYSDDLPDIVESSNNLGVINLESGGSLQLLNLCRSASNDERDAQAYRIAQYQQQFSMQVEIDGAYPGWQPNRESPLLKDALNLYLSLFNKEASIQVIHAGLECGLLSNTYPDCDIISFGPTITGAHSPRERVNIDSVDKFWLFLTEFISKLTK